AGGHLCGDSCHERHVVAEPIMMTPPPAAVSKCDFCPESFGDSFFYGFFTASAEANKEGHQIACSENPANSCGCAHCGEKFLTTDETAEKKQEHHAEGCLKNPVNQCRFCGDAYGDSLVKT
ncbi:unnamed protein product, partial [Polarella glacialis]